MPANPLDQMDRDEQRKAVELADELTRAFAEAQNVYNDAQRLGRLDVRITARSLYLLTMAAAEHFGMTVTETTVPKVIW
jgi:hypothetical protein